MGMIGVSGFIHRHRRLIVSNVICSAILLSLNNLLMQSAGVALPSGSAGTAGGLPGRSDWHARELVIAGGDAAGLNSVQNRRDSKSSTEGNNADPVELRSTDAPLDVVIMVLSAPENIARREAIRDTWVRLGNPNSVYTFFLVGGLALDDNVLSALEDEAQTKKDVVIVYGLYDDYSRLTEKILAGFVHVTGMERPFRYLLKVDDNSWVRPDKILQAITEHAVRVDRDTRLYIGYMDGRATPKSTGKWAEKNWRLCDRYIPYATGSGYVLSQDLVQHLSDSREFLMRYLNEDVSVGAWLAGLDVSRIHDARFDTQHKSRGCNNAYVVSHPHEPVAMRDAYQNIERTGRQCESEHLSRPSYQYNWSVVPTQCCIGGTAKM